MHDLRLELVAKIVVFDSGIGSLSIIKPIQRVCKAEIIYYADQKNYPYGHKSKSKLDSIIKQTILMLQTKFSPDVMVIASNTPSLILNIPRKIFGVTPPLDEAQKITKTKKIGILATKSAIKSKGLSKYIKNKKISKTFKFFKINGSELVDLVESGKIFTNKKYCKIIINQILNDPITKNSIDTITLSSTHLPFLKTLLEKEFPNVTFLDPGEIVAKKVCNVIKNNQSKKNLLRIFTSGEKIKLQKILFKLKIKNKVNFLPT